MGLDAPWHWVVVVALVAVLFGYKKLPDAARSLGRSLRIFKTEIKGMGEDDKARQEAATPALTASSDAPAANVVAPAAPVTAEPANATVVNGAPAPHSAPTDAAPSQPASQPAE